MRFLWAIVILLAVGLPAFAETAPITTQVVIPTANQLEFLHRHKLETKALDRMYDRKILTLQQVVAAKSANQDEVVSVFGRNLTELEVDQILGESQSREARNEQAGLTGLFTFFNIVRFIAACLFIISLGWILRNFIASIPLEAYEVIAWIAVAVGLYSGHLWPGMGLWLVIPAALGLIGCLFLSTFLHFRDHEPSSRLMQVLSIICAVVWGVTARSYQSDIIGFMSVAAIESFLGFSVLVLPMCVGLGFREDSVIPRAMMASLAILVGYVGVEITGVQIPNFECFKTGGLFMGAFVYYLGCLIVSSKYYDEKNYLSLQVLTIVSGIAAFYFGAAFHIPSLLGIGGTFFVIYLIMKYFEIPWGEVGWAWCLFGFAIFLYAATYYAWNHPQYFLWGIK